VRRRLAAACTGALCLATALAAQDAPPTVGTGATVDRSAFQYSRELPPSSGGLVVVPLDAHVLAHSRGRGRLADLRVVDDDGRQVPYVLEDAREPLTVDVALEPRTDAPLPGVAPAGQRSAYTLRLPYAGLWSVRLVLDTPARVFERRVQVAAERPPDRRHRDDWFETLADLRWSHTDPDTPAPALALRIGEPEATELLVVVHEGDNSPLPISASRLELPSHSLRFAPPAGAPLRLHYGQPDLAAPTYDVALLRGELLQGPATELSLGDVTAAAARDDRSRMPRWIFWTILAAAVLALLGLIARLLRAG
jgi:hypothetical protein